MLLAVKETRGSKYYQVQIINEPNHNPSEKKMMTWIQVDKSACPTINKSLS